MKVIVLVYWTWGDKSFFIYDLSSKLSREDLLKLMDEEKRGEKVYKLSVFHHSSLDKTELAKFLNSGVFS